MPGPAALSTKHTLAVTNRGDATASDVVALAREVRDGVADAFGVTLVNEPVLVGTSTLSARGVRRPGDGDGCTAGRTSPARRCPHGTTRRTTTTAAPPDLFGDVVCGEAAAPPRTRATSSARGQ